MSTHVNHCHLIRVQKHRLEPLSLLAPVGFSARQSISMSLDPDPAAPDRGRDTKETAKLRFADREETVEHRMRQSFRVPESIHPCTGLVDRRGRGGCRFRDRRPSTVGTNWITGDRMFCSQPIRSEHKKRRAPRRAFRPPCGSTQPRRSLFALRMSSRNSFRSSCRHPVADLATSSTRSRPIPSA